MPYGTELGGPILVLYVEDDPALVALVRKALQRRGHHMEHASNGDAALARIAEGGVDVVALDHSLAGETGFDLLTRLGPRGGRPPVVYVTGSVDARLAVEALKNGADDYVIKDVEGGFFDLLIAALEQALERFRLKRARAENERAVRDARDRAEMLLKEVNHRVANSLGMVAAMVRLQASVITDPGAQHALQETQSRISAVAGVHRHLYSADHVDVVEISDYLGNLLQELGGSMRARETNPYIEAKIAPAIVKTDKAVSLGVMVGELITNAFKYAYPEGETGPVRVIASPKEDGWFQIVVEDDGVGFDGEVSTRGTGLGSTILKAMARNIDGEIVNEPKARGTRFVISFPTI